MKKKRIIRFSIIGVVLIIILLAVGKKAGWIGKKDVTEVSTEKVTKRTIIETVSASGKIQPEVEVKLSPDVSGEVVELLIKEGDKVKAGQKLMSFDIDKIKKAGYPTVTAVLVTNSDDYENLTITEGSCNELDKVIMAR